MDQVMAKLEDGEAGRVLAAEDGEVVGIINPLGSHPVAAPLAGARQQGAGQQSALSGQPEPEPVALPAPDHL